MCENCKCNLVGHGEIRPITHSWQTKLLTQKEIEDIKSIVNKSYKSCNIMPIEEAEQLLIDSEKCNSVKNNTIENVFYKELDELLSKFINYELDKYGTNEATILETEGARNFAKFIKDKCKINIT